MPFFSNFLIFSLISEAATSASDEAVGKKSKSKSKRDEGGEEGWGEEKRGEEQHSSLVYT